MQASCASSASSGGCNLMWLKRQRGRERKLGVPAENGEAEPPPPQSCQEHKREKPSGNDRGSGQRKSYGAKVASEPSTWASGLRTAEDGNGKYREQFQPAVCRGKFYGTVHGSSRTVCGSAHAITLCSIAEPVRQGRPAPAINRSGQPALACAAT